MELESKLQGGREQSNAKILFDYTNESSRTTTTPMEGKSFSREESANESDHQILRSSNSINKPITMKESILLRGAETLHEMKRRRESRSSLYGEHENSIVVSTAIAEKTKKVLQSHSIRVRRIEPSKALGRLTRTSKVVTTNKIFPHSRISKEPPQGGGVKEKERIRGWAR